MQDGNTRLKLVGVTATPDRGDRVGMHNVFDTCAYEYNILDGINDGWLVPIKQQFVQVGTLDYSKVKTVGGELCGAELAEILEESGGQRMDSALLKNANLHTIAKQRRQEALKFFQNFDFIVENGLLGKFASMKALLAEVAKLQKPKAEVTEGDDEAKSDSGPSTEGEAQSQTVPSPKTAEDIAFEAMLQCDANGISFKDLLLALKEQQSLLNSEAA